MARSQGGAAGRRPARDTRSRSVYGRDDGYGGQTLFTGVGHKPIQIIPAAEAEAAGVRTVPKQALPKMSK